MTRTPKPEKPDLSEHEEEGVPFDEVMKKLVEAKPAPKKPEPDKDPQGQGNPKKSKQITRDIDDRK